MGIRPIGEGQPGHHLMQGVPQMNQNTYYYADALDWGKRRLSIATSSTSNKHLLNRVRS